MLSKDTKVLISMWFMLVMSVFLLVMGILLIVRVPEEYLLRGVVFTIIGILGLFVFGGNLLSKDTKVLLSKYFDLVMGVFLLVIGILFILRGPDKYLYVGFIATVAGILGLFGGKFIKGR